MWPFLRRVRRFLKYRTFLFLILAFVFLYTLRILQLLMGSYPAKEASLTAENYFIPRSIKKIHWFDYGQEENRVGLGEYGKPAFLPKEYANIEEKLYSENGFNGALSDKIALNRSTPDLRHPACKKFTYIESLPTVSVVVPFHNEHWSTLLRTAVSVINRSPPQLLKEIILVDDASTKEFLKAKLDEQVSHMPKVHIVRVQNRSGLITARLAGAKVATADVIIFLDSHTEATVNWLPPLLEPIALNYRCATCPFIDVIAYDTFEYRAQDEGARGAFDWEFFYKRLPLLPHDLRDMPRPFPSPVMAGGLFAISRVFFWELGGYDPGLDIWGGEQYELSFKIWQCGGRMVDVPCSRVGHIYRKFAPFPNPNHGDFVGKNYRRVAEVWMDEYAQYLYNRRPHYREIDPGDISEQKALRKRLKCKSFHWFMTQIAFDLTAKYPVVDPEPFATGKIRAAAEPSLCVDMHHGAEGDKLQLKTCTDNATAEQEMLFSPYKDIKSKTRNMCFDLPDATPTRPVLLWTCHLGGGNQRFRYYTESKTVVFGLDHRKCLDWNRTTHNLYIADCEVGSETQKWTVDNVNEEMMARWDVTNRRVIEPEVHVEE